MYGNIMKLQSNDETSNCGKRWNIEDDLKLIKYMEENKSYDDIAIEFKRTIGSIKSRVLDKIIFSEYNEENCQELAKKYRYDDVEYFKKCLENKKRICEEKLKPKVKKEDILEKIMYRLDVIEKRLELLEDEKNKNHPME
jgi:hypothetical protein